MEENIILDGAALYCQGKLLKGHGWEPSAANISKEGIYQGNNGQLRENCMHLPWNRESGRSTAVSTTSQLLYHSDPLALYYKFFYLGTDSPYASWSCSSGTFQRGWGWTKPLVLQLISKPQLIVIIPFQHNYFRFTSFSARTPAGLGNLPDMETLTLLSGHFVFLTPWLIYLFIYYCNQEYEKYILSWDHYVAAALPPPKNQGQQFLSVWRLLSSWLLSNLRWSNGSHTSMCVILLPCPGGTILLWVPGPLT